MMSRTLPVSPIVKPRVAGALYLGSILAGMSAEMSANSAFSTSANLIGAACYVAVTLLLYDLFKVVSKNVSFVAALFSLAGCTVTILGLFDLPATGINSLVFFGCYCLLLAYLIFRSRFMPRFLSVLLMITGVGWLTYLSPTLGHQLFRPYLMITGLLGEGALTLWLLIAGVNVQRWIDRASFVQGTRR